MISGKRKTIGVFQCKAYSLFDEAVYHTLEETAKEFDLDVVIFTTVGYFSSQNEYDEQERGMFAFAPIEKLDGIIVAPDTYEIEGFRDQLYEELAKRAKCPIVAIRHQSGDFDCVYTDQSLALRPLCSSVSSTVPPSGEYFMALSSRMETSLASAFSSPLTWSPGATEAEKRLPFERARAWKDCAVSSTSSDRESGCICSAAFSSSIRDR